VERRIDRRCVHAGGKVWWVAFDPSIGGGIQKTRPAQIISNNAANAALNRVIVIPLTSQVAKIYPGEALVTLNGEQRTVMADQVTTASKQRLRTKLGSLDQADITTVENALLFQLGGGARIHACASMGHDSRPQRDH
jgi:mRNA interferase MazF